MAGNTQLPTVWFPTIQAHTGTDIFTRSLAQELNRRGVRAEITWLPHRAEYFPLSAPKLTPPAGVTVAHVNSWLPPRFLPADLPVITTVHLCVHDPALYAYNSILQSQYHRYWIRKNEATTLQRSHKVTAVSEYVARMTATTFGINDIQCIPNGIDTESVFVPKFKTHPHVPFRLLYLGSWTRRKGIDLLAPIMSQLGPSFELFLNRDPRARRRHISLPSNCRVIDFQTTPQQVSELLQQVDALLFPTRLEGFGLVAAEAQACGVPVVATNCSSLPTIVVDGKTGYLCRKDVVEDFVYRVRALRDVPDQFRQMQHAARRYAKTRFSMSSMVERYIALYRAVLQRL